MSLTFIPGHATEATINLVDIGITGNVLTLQRSRSSQPKPVFGSDFRREIPGQGSGTLAIEGHVTVEQIGDLETIYASQVSLAYVIQVGEAGGDTDAGTFAGNLVVTDYSLESDAEGEWEYSLSATLDGAPVYTAPTP
jgi:hypothetical protein